MSDAKALVLTYLPFTVFDADGITPLTGQAGMVTGTFLSRNGAAAPEAVSVTEIGVTGHYFASFTPLTVATYDLEVTCPDGRVVGELYEVWSVNLDDLDTAISTLNDISVADIFAHVVEAGLDVDEFLRIFMAVLAGLSSGGGTATNIFRDLADSKNRISMTVDVNGNRTVVITRDGS